MLYQIISVISFIHVVLYLFILEFKSIKYIQDINYSFKKYSYFYYWYYIKNFYNLIFIVSLFLNNIYINVLNILLAYFGMYIIFKYKNIIKLKITNRIKILFLLLVILNVLLFYIFSYNICFNIVLLPLISSIGIVINCIIDKILNYKYFRKAKQKLKSIDPFIIGVTGSSGKTSVKNIIYDILKDKEIVFKTKKSFNTLKGIEISINDLKDIYVNSTLVLEMGAKKKNDIKEICRLVKADIGIITNILPQHLETFKSIDNVLKEKSNIILSIKENGYAIFNIDDVRLKDYIKVIKEKRKDLKIYTYSLNDESAYVYAYDIKYSLYNTSFKIKVEGFEYDVFSKLIGKHSVYNIICSVIVCLIKGMDIMDIIRSINNIDYIDNRLKLERKDNMIILNDSYNSNVLGFKNAIDVLMLYENDKYLITPGIVETKNDEINEEIAYYLLDKNINVILINNKSSYVYEKIFKNNSKHNYLVYKSFKEAYKYVLNEAKNKEICVLIENDLTDDFFL